MPPFSFWIDCDEIKGFDKYREAIKQGIQRSKCALIFVGPNGLSEYQLLEVEELGFYYHNEEMSIGAVLLPGCTDEMFKEVRKEHLQLLGLADNKNDLRKINADTLNILIDTIRRGNLA